MLQRLVRTSDDPTLLITRLILGVVFFAHGAQKALGWYGGPGFEATLDYFSSMGIPQFLGVLAVTAEFLGGLGLIIGFLGRVAALGVIVNMVVAAVMVHLPNGFFMNWTGTQSGEGFEFHLLAIAAGIVVLVHGSGMLSADREIYKAWLRRDVVVDAERPAA